MNNLSQNTSFFLPRKEYKRRDVPRYQAYLYSSVRFVGCAACCLVFVQSLKNIFVSLYIVTNPTSRDRTITGHIIGKSGKKIAHEMHWAEKVARVSTHPNPHHAE